MSGHAVVVRRDVAVCLTCGAVGTARDGVIHAADTFLRRAS